jgi:hypothetical protein
MGNRKTASSLVISMGEPVTSNGFMLVFCAEATAEATVANVEAMGEKTRELRGAVGDAAYGSIGLSSVVAGNVVLEDGEELVSTARFAPREVSWDDMIQESEAVPDDIQESNDVFSCPKLCLEFRNSLDVVYVKWSNQVSRGKYCAYPENVVERTSSIEENTVSKR